MVGFGTIAKALNLEIWFESTAMDSIVQWVVYRILRVKTHAVYEVRPLDLQRKYHLKLEFSAKLNTQSCEKCIASF